MMSGKESIVIRFKNLFNKADLKSTYFCQLKNDDMLKCGAEELKLQLLQMQKEFMTLLRV